MIKLSLKVLGGVHTSSGKNIEEAIVKLNPPIVKGKGILTVDNGDRKADKVIHSSIMAKLFGPNQKLKEMFIKKYAMMFSV